MIPGDCWPTVSLLLGMPLHLVQRHFLSVRVPGFTDRRTDEQMWVFFREVNLLGTPTIFSNGSTPLQARLLAEERSEEYDTFMEEKGSQRHFGWHCNH